MDSDDFSGVRELAGDCMDMLVSVGIIDSISPRWPDEVIEQWHDKIEAARLVVNRITNEVQEFASAWDDPLAGE